MVLDSAKGRILRTRIINVDVPEILKCDVAAVRGCQHFMITALFNTLEETRRRNSHVSATTASGGSRGWIAAEDLDASTVLRIGHCYVSDVDVRDNVCLPRVLTERSHGNPVRAVAIHVGDEYVRGVGLE